jgi:ABC-type dipeptide/oligopeptide/nickel transport system permease component
MTGYLLRRLGGALVSAGLMSVFAFALIALAPGDPIAAELRFLGVPARPDTVDRLRREFDLDAPVAVRYARWLNRVATLDLGTSIASGRPVAREIGGALASTLALALTSSLFMMAISSVAGGAAAVWHQGWISRGLRASTIAVLSIPLYWLALAVVFIGAVTLDWSSVVGEPSPSNLVVPAAIVALGPGLAVGRLIRQRILDERLEDHVRFATGLGRSPWQILSGDIAVVIAPAIITAWATSFGSLLGGSVIAERVFDRPGLGTLALQAVAARDYPVLQAYLMLAGLLFLVVNWLAEIVSAWIDPRLRRAGVHG